MVFNKKEGFPGNLSRMALADELKREAKKYETVKTAELEWTDRIKLDHLILFLKEYIQKIYPLAENSKPMN